MYKAKTEPLPFQRDVIEKTWGLPAYAFFWEQGLGKSKALCDTAGRLHVDSEIDSLLLIAPKGLHRNFITREWPKHVDDAHAGQSFFWNGDKATQVGWLNSAREFLDSDGGLKALGMSYDGACTKVGQRLITAFLARSKRGVMVAADESGRIKNPDAERTKALLLIGADSKVKFRRIATGTPVSVAPWDVWSQIKFIDPGYWRPHGLGSIEAMKSTFGEWERMVQKIPTAQAKAMERKFAGYYNGANIPESQRTLFTHLNGGVSLMRVPKQAKNDAGRPQFKNLGQLRDILEPIRSRLLKDDVLHDLPPKTYQTVEFEMTNPQKKAYASLANLGFALLDDRQCTADRALTLMLRLQQIACGYLVADLDHARDDEEPEVLPFDPNPRVELLKEIATDLDHPALIWCRFRADVNQICKALESIGKTCTRYDGTLNEDETAASEERFHRGAAQFFVSTQSKGGEGLTLIEARTAIYYSNTFKLTERLQSEDRPHRIGQKNAVNNIDIVARGTIDEHLLQSHLAKFEMASTIVGDRLRPWIVPPGELI